MRYDLRMKLVRAGLLYLSQTEGMLAGSPLSLPAPAVATDINIITIGAPWTHAYTGLQCSLLSLNIYAGTVSRSVDTAYS